ncbi:MAG: hypothetical protein J6D19_03305 [Clostridia bacterium]|nr:hypothetical protein [Clostridia bacterium]
MFTENLKKTLKNELAQIEEDIEHMELNDHAYTPCYAKLVKKQKFIKKTIKKIERMEK